TSADSGTSPMPSKPMHCRLTPLAAVVLANVAPANTLTVQNCSDDPAASGTLRKAVAAATPGDTVDLSGLKLQCSTITLINGGVANGPIVIDKATGPGGIGLKIVGPGADMLSIDGAYSDRVFTHTGSGQLIIDGLTVTRGYINAAYIATPPK